jgi:DNA replication protein DnaC
MSDDFTMFLRCPECGKKWNQTMQDVNGYLAARYPDTVVEMCDNCDQQRKQIDQQSQLTRRMAVLCEKAGFPDDRGCHDYQWELGNQELLAKLEQNPHRSFWITGDNRTGKTWAVCKAGQNFLGKHMHTDIKYYDADDLCREYSEICMSGEETNRKAWIKNNQRRNLLIIDDLGKEPISACQGEGLCKILDRARYYGAVWIVSNKGLSAGDDPVAACFARKEHANKFISRIKELNPIIHGT